MHTRNEKLADAVIAFLLVGVFATMLVMAADLPSRAALFPKVAGWTGMIAGIVALAHSGYWLIRSSRADPVGRLLAEPVEDYGDDEEESVLRTANGRSWMIAIFWLGVFGVLVAAFGIVIAMFGYAAVYLRYSAWARRTTCVLYAVLLAGLVHVTFTELLHLRLPTGLFFA